MNILIISPHPDDESIGCGGTICKHVATGDRIEVIFLSSGEKGGHGKPEEETKLLREQEARDAAAILGINGIEYWREPDGNITAGEKNIARLLKNLEIFRPDMIYCPHEGEDHPDHRAAASLLKQVIHQWSLPFAPPVVWLYEVWTPIQQIGLIEDISDYAETKRQAIRAHKSQCAVLKFDEAILGLNRYRGEMHSWPGGDYAEVFAGPGFPDL